MGTQTENIDLFLTNMETDGEELFDFDRDLNDNFVKIDDRFGAATLTLSATGWSGTVAPYSQTINVQGLKETDNPHVMLKKNSDFEIAQNEISEYAKIYDGKTEDGSITFYAKEQTGIDLELIIKKL